MINRGQSRNRFGRGWCDLVLCSVALGIIPLFSTSAPADTSVNEAQDWGYNGDGNLGNNSTTNSSSPVIPNGITSGVTAVAAGTYHSLAVMNGGLYGWGDSGNGQVGNGSTNTAQKTPVPVTGLSSGVTAVAAGSDHSLAIQNGALYGWGANFNGQLGIGTDNTEQTTPIAISGFSSGVTAIAGGEDHSLIVQNGALYACGYNNDGQLGNGNSTQEDTPVPVNNLSSGVTAVAAAFFQSLAIQNGGLYAWGDNSNGQLGDGTTTTQYSPVPVTGLSSGVTAVASGEEFSLAVKGGNVYAWGSNNDGQLGNGSADNNNNHLTAVEVDPSQLTNIVAVAAGQNSSYALSSDGSIWVWGDNSYGELGLGSSTTQFDLPQQLLPPAGEAYTAIDAGGDGYFAIAILATPEPAALSLLVITPLVLLPRRRKTGMSACK